LPIIDRLSVTGNMVDLQMRDFFYSIVIGTSIHMRNTVGDN